MIVNLIAICQNFGRKMEHIKKCLWVSWFWFGFFVSSTIFQNKFLIEFLHRNFFRMVRESDHYHHEGFDQPGSFQDGGMSPDLVKIFKLFLDILK